MKRDLQAVSFSVFLASICFVHRALAIACLLDELVNYLLTRQHHLAICA